MSPRSSTVSLRCFEAQHYLVRVSWAVDLPGGVMFFVVQSSYWLTQMAEAYQVQLGAFGFLQVAEVH